MKYLVEYTNQILDDDGKWHKIGLFPGHIFAESENPDPAVYEVKTFQELQELAEEMYGMSNTKTLFRHRPMVEIRFGMEGCCNITERNFNKYAPYVFRTIYEPYHPTMKWLLENLSAEDFAQYAQDRGWNNIVITE